MKILYVITKSNFGGAQRYVLDLAIAAKKNSHDVSIACGGSGELVEKANEVGIQICTIQSFQRDINFRKEIKSIFELASIIRDYDPDIVHLNSSKAGGTGAFVSRLLGVPKIIFTAHGWPYLEPRNSLWKLLAWLGSFLTGLFAHAVIVVSQNDYRHSPSMLVRRKSHVIHTAVSNINYLDKPNARIALFSDSGIIRHHRDVWLVTVAELNHNKNIETAIKAVAKHNGTHDQKIFYSVIGSGDLHKKLDSLIEELGAHNSISLLGYVDDARQYLKAFDLFLLSSKKEGLPYSILEAGAAGLPVVASEVGGIPEIIKSEHMGQLINPLEVDSITNSLRWSVENIDKTKAQASNLRNFVTAEFSLEKMVEKTLTIYTSNTSRALN